MKKVTTCATILYVIPENKFLICHPTGKPMLKMWSLPKGIKEDNESVMAAAKRELKEETGITIESSLFHYIGLYEYSLTKNIALHIVFVNKESVNLKCDSKFCFPNTTKMIPEVNSYKYVTLEESKELLNSSTYNILDAVLEDTLKKYGIK